MNRLMLSVLVFLGIFALLVSASPQDAATEESSDTEGSESFYGRRFGGFGGYGGYGRPYFGHGGFGRGYGGRGYGGRGFGGGYY